MKTFKVINEICESPDNIKLSKIAIYIIAELAPLSLDSIKLLERLINALYSDESEMRLIPGMINYELKVVENK